jgi:ABC-2 type transport system ATP-binding protein
MAFHLQSLSRSFGTFRALDDVTLTVAEGDCYGLIGHNGAGKTTALRIALGLDRRFTGRVVVDGFDAASDPVEVRTRTGGLIEVPGFHGGVSGRANLVMLGRLQGLSRLEARSEAVRLLELVGLDHAAERRVKGWSQGMRQRLGIAQALLGRPRYVLLDEPTNGLDPIGMAELREVLRRITQDEGQTVVLSSHQLHDVAELCNRIALVHRGRLLVEATTEDLVNEGAPRHRVVTDDDAHAAELLADLGASAHAADAGLEVELGEVTPAHAARTLVERGRALSVIAPVEPDLEQVYLRFAREEEGERPHAAPPPLDTPGERTAPGGWFGRMSRYELTRAMGRSRTLVLLAAPCLLAIGAVRLRWSEAVGDAAAVSDRELFSATDVTAFEGVAHALRVGLPLLMVIAAGLASQSLAGELSRGTLRNVLLRPLKRFQVALGKAATCLGVVVLAYVALVATSLLASGVAFDYGDVTEILPNGERYVLLPASEVRPVLEQALVAPLLPLAAYVSLGFLAGALATSGAGALALALGAVLGLDLFRAFARSLGAEAALPSAYLPSPLGDTSFIHYYLDRAMGVSNAAFDFAGTGAWVPAIWAILAVVLASVTLTRRTVP